MLKNAVANNPLSREEFRRVIARERGRCDRNEHEFSLLVFGEPPAGHPNSIDEMLKVLAGRIREIDEVGWLDHRRLAVILPYTSFNGATTLAQCICLKLTAFVRCTIYTYPGQWFPHPPSELTTGSSSPVRRTLDKALAHRIPAWKRVLDIVGSIAGLIFLSPVLLLIAGVIKIVSPGPAVLKQHRVGHHGRHFRIWKFRTMKVDADAGPHQSHLNSLMSMDLPMTKLDVKQDPRVFFGGNIIRRSYLDELPQLINVLRGEMSLVGPRPCIPYEAQEYQLWQTRRFDAVPGMTGLWQVSGKNGTTFKEMIRLDIAYASHQSLWLDIRIVFKTVPVIVEEILGALLHRRRT